MCLSKSMRRRLTERTCCKNRARILHRAGWPAWPGLELSGTVEDMGKTARQKSGFRIGDNVCALVGGGGYAEKAAVPYPLLMPIPKNITMEEAASLPEVYATSYLNLFYEGKLAPGQTLYVAAGASGLASAAIPLGKAAGAYVVTSVQTCAQADRIRPLGRITSLSRKRKAFRPLSNDWRRTAGR